LSVSKSPDSIAAEGSASRRIETKTSSRSATIQRTDEQEFALDAPSRDALGAGMRDVFSAKGFKKIKDGSFLKVSKEIDESFGSGAGISSEVRENMVKEVKEKMPKVRYMVVGTVDFSIPTIDPIGGQHKYTGRITGAVWEMDEDGGSIPDNIGDLKPTQVSLSADTQQDAKAQVIEKISGEAANDIITKLRNKAAL